MTISTNPVPDLQRDQIITASYRLCGMLEAAEVPDADQIAAAATFLSLCLMELQGEGVVLTGKVRSTESLVAETSEYDLDDDVFDVFVDSDDVIGMVVDGDGKENPVRSVTGAEYQAIGDKTETAEQPTKCFIDKGSSPLTLVFWPVPSSSDYTFRYTAVKFLRNLDTGAQTAEVRRLWIPWLIHRLAYYIALSSSKANLAGGFKAFADDLKTKALPIEEEPVAIQLHVGRGGGRSGRYRY